MAALRATPDEPGAARAAGDRRSPGDPADPQASPVRGPALAGLMFSAIGILTGATVYLFVSGSSESAAESRTSDLAVGRTLQLARERRGPAPQRPHVQDQCARPTCSGIHGSSETFRTWIYNNAGGARAAGEAGQPARPSPGSTSATSRAGREAVVGGSATASRSSTPTCPTTGRSSPCSSSASGRCRASCSRSRERPEEVQSALQALRGQRLTALVVSVIVAGLIGFLVASLITSRVKRLAAAAGRARRGPPRHAACTRAAATRSATSAARSIRCGSRWPRPSTPSPPSATGSRRSSPRSTRR